MKRFISAFLLLCLFGCSSTEHIDPALQLRHRLLNCETCRFDAIITADYGDKVYSFSLNCTMDSNGDVSFCVVQPDTINGITGKISANGGALTFDDQVLAFPTLADGQLSPVSGPYLLIKTLRSGYIRACGEEEDLWKLQISDSYAQRADILYAGRRYLAMQIENFEIR